MRKRLDVRFAAYTIVACGLLATVVYFIHAYQVRKHAGLFLGLAGKAEESGELQKAADYLGQYLGMEPKDIDALAKYGVLLANEKLAQTQQARFRAMLVLEKVLFREPNRHEIRRRLVSLSVDLGRYASARNDIKNHLLPAFPNDAELEYLLGRCCEATGNYTEARMSYESASQHAPQNMEIFVRLAALLRDRTQDVLRAKERPSEVLKQADQTMDNMVEANARSFRAFLIRAEYRRTRGLPRDAIAEDIARARVLAPDAAEVLLASAQLACDRNDFDEASNLLQRGAKLNPDDWRLYQAMARVESSAGRNDQALECLRQGLKVLPRNGILLWDLADFLATAGRADEAADAIERLAREGSSASELEILRGRLLMHQERWSEAARLLEGAYTNLIARSSQPGGELAKQLSQRAGLLLGQCYEQIGDSDRSFAAYNRVTSRDERSVAGRLGMAMTRWSQGRLNEALDQYRMLMRLPDAPPIGWVDFARLLLLRNLERDERQRNWPEVDQALALASRLKPLPLAVVLLRAEALAAQNQFDRARAELLNVYGDPKARPSEIWVGLAALEERQGRDDVALSTLLEAQQYCGDRLELRLAKARYWAAKGQDKARTGLPPLTENLDAFSAVDRRRLLQGLGKAYLQCSLLSEAKQIWQRLADDQPSDLRSRIVLFDLAAIAGDNAETRRWQDEIRRIEGDDGVLWRYAQVAVLLDRAKRGDKSGLPAARAFLAAVNVRRSGWSRIPLCEARLNDLDGRPDAALPLYLRAIHLGERDSYAYSRALEILYSQRRYSEAYQLLRKVTDQTLLPQETQRVAAEVSLLSNDNVRALNLAQSGAKADSKDFRDHLWRGRVFWVTGHPRQAEVALLRARELDSDAPETWVSLIQFLAATGKKDLALAEVKSADAKLIGKSGNLALAQCHEFVGHSERARELFQLALKVSGDDATVLRVVALFHLRNNGLDEAKRVLLKLSQHSDGDSASWARRLRAQLLALEGSPARTEEALSLVNGLETGSLKSTAAADKILDERARAQILAMQDSRTARRTAAQILEGFIERQEGTPDDHLLSAQLHEAIGDWLKARKRYLGLLSLPGGDSPVTLVTIARSLLRHGEPDGAEQALRSLEQQDSNAPVTKEIRARILHLQGRTVEAVALLREIAATAGIDLRGVAEVLEDLGQQSEAEEMYRSFQANSKRPEDALTLVHYLIRRKRYTDALNLADPFWSTCPTAAVAEACLPALAEMPPDHPQLARVSARIEAALAQASDHLGLIASLAAVRNFQRRFDEAESLYRRVLKINPRHLTALNNLAWLLAMKPGHGDEALGVVSRAVEVNGLDPGLLDTRAVAFLSLKRPDAIELAAKDLATVTAEAPSATSYFHLAQAQILAGKRKEAAQAWQRAKALGLTVSHLHPLEHAEYERLAAEMK